MGKLVTAMHRLFPALLTCVRQTYGEKSRAEKSENIAANGCPIPTLTEGLLR